jgi:hypothetical protein
MASDALLLFLRRLLNLFHFIFVSHGKHSLLSLTGNQKIIGIHMNIIQAWLTVCPLSDTAMQFLFGRAPHQRASDTAQGAGGGGRRGGPC